MERPPAVPACPLLKWVGIGAGMAYALFLFHMPVMRGMAEVLRMLREHAGMKWGVDGLQFYSGESPCVFPWLSPISSISNQHVEVCQVGKRLKKAPATRNEAWERAGENGTDEIFRKR